MGIHRQTSVIPVPAAALYRWHAQPGALIRLTPPWERVEVVEKGEGIDPGARVVMRVRLGPLKKTWEALHIAPEALPAGALGFADEQVKGPFASWVHQHRMLPAGAAASTLEDEVHYTLPLEPVSRWVAGWFVRRKLRRMFAFRHRRTLHDVMRHFTAEVSPMRIAISGASGLIGTALTGFLQTGGHTVVPLVRGTAGPGEIAWSVKDQTIDAAALEGFDAVIHLAGAPVADGRWTDARKTLIRDSRVDGTRLLATALAGLERKPKVFVSASAVGFYGDRAAEPLDEDSAPGTGFLADVCAAWEAAAEPARTAGIRVVHPRIGVVLSPQGGALDKMLTPVKFGVAGKIGDGKQYMSWIALDDVLGAMLHIIATDAIEGPVNFTAPTPVTNKAFMKTLGRVLRRPTVLPLPAFAVKT
ncbi:MAG: hypothetical protein ACI9MR_003417, partial [Myxococcota bacterium]